MKEQIKKTRILAATLSASVALLSFAFGAIWVRALHDGIDQSRLDDSGRDLRSKIAVIGQLVMADMKALKVQELVRSIPTLQDKVPNTFDLVVLYSSSREPLGGVTRVGKEHSLRAVHTETIRNAMPGDSAFFDRAASEGGLSGFLMFEGRPFVIGVSRVDAGDERKGFILAGRWLDIHKFAPASGMADQAFDIFSPEATEGLPPDVEAAQAAMKSDQQFFGHLQRRGAGIGYLKFNDVFERTAFIVRFPWVGVGASSEQKSLIWLLIAAFALGISLYTATSLSLGWIERQRKRSPGLGGMSDNELRELVEGFPGYAFALNARQEYIAMSRALAGVSGKESVYFVGRLFGSVSGESGMNPAELAVELAGSNFWPSTKAIEFSIAGLRDQFDYNGSCHLVAGRRILFVVLQAKQVVEAATGIHVESKQRVDAHDAKADIAA